MRNTEHYIGLMSGTSLDGIDSVIASFDTQTVIHAHHFQPYPKAIKHALTQLIDQQHGTLLEIGTLQQHLSILYAQAVNTLKQRHPQLASSLQAVGCHGQTIYHQPEGEQRFSWQLINAHTLAQHIQLPIITDFRGMHMALGGQGAPLAPLFHDAVFRHPHVSRAIVNIGGISNISILKPDAPLLGFDTGPGNTLLDQWIQKHQHQAYDHNGQWAATGTCNTTLLNRLLEDDFFKQPAPKSTGREIFNLAWLESHLHDSADTPANVQTTLTELTACTITQSLSHDPVDEIYLCGGGARNRFLLERLKALSTQTIQTTETLGIACDQVEASLIAWLTQKRFQQERLSLNGKKPILMGVIYTP